MALVEYDRVWTGRQAGGGESEIETLSHRYYIPDKGAECRIKRYLAAEKLLDPAEHLPLYRKEKTGGAISADEEKHWIPVDFPGMLTRLMRQYTLGEEFHVRALPRGAGLPSGEKLIEVQADAQREIDRITDVSSLVKLFRQTAEQLPALGDAVLRVDIDDREDPDTGATVPTALVRYVRPHHYFPKTDPLDDARVVGVSLAWVFPRGADGSAELMVLREDHSIVDGMGRIDYALNALDSAGKLGKSLPVEEYFEGLVGGPTGIDEIPIVHFGYQTKAGQHFGNSEITRISDLILALENRLAQEDEVLEKHSRPKLIVGPGILGTDGKSALKDFDVIEVSPDIFEKAVKPEYLTWDMQIGGIQHEIEKLEEYLFMTTETSPASFGLERDGSQVESARALRFKAHRTVNKVNDLRGEIEPGMRAVYRIAQKMELAARKASGTGTGYRRADVSIRFGDPIVEDQTQEVQDYVMRKQAGLVSRRRALMDLDNLPPAEASAEVEEILQDQVDEAAATTATLGGILPDAGGAPGLDLNPEPEVPAAPEAAPEAAPVKAGETGLGVAEDVQKVVLNGAQVASLVTIVTTVATGELPRDSALAIIETAFGLPPDEAARILGSAGENLPDEEDEADEEDAGRAMTEEEISSGPPGPRVRT